MKRHIPLWIITFGSILFAILFHQKPAGLNLLIFNTFILTVWLVFKRINFKNSLHVVLFLATFTSAVTSVISHTLFGIIMNYLCLILLSAAAVFPEGRSIFSLIGVKFFNVFFGFQEFFKRLSQAEDKPGKSRKVWRFVKIAAIPIIIILIFVAIYRGANPWFDDIAGSFFKGIGDFLNSIFGEIDWWWLLTAIFGFIFLVFLLLGRAFEDIVYADTNAKDTLERKRRRRIYKGKKRALLMELRSAIFLLVGLNVVLLLVNALDVVNVWFGFEWEGEYLKQFVHEGTWLLIFSIMISIAIVLFYFRKNLNFFSKNRFLKVLAYIWLIQNIVLAISVAVRNMHYIDYFNLAYKRIGIMFFLLAVVIGILTVMIKIKSKRTAFYLLRMNALNIFLVFMLMSFFNWDSIIARYNFSHAEHSFIHYNYLMKLDDKALPWMMKSENELMEIDAAQLEKFEFAENYLSYLDYYYAVEAQRDRFVNDYPDHHWLSWNYADHRAYKMLTSGTMPE